MVVQMMSGPAHQKSYAVMFTNIVMRVLANVYKRLQRKDPRSRRELPYSYGYREHPSQSRHQELVYSEGNAPRTRT